MKYLEHTLDNGLTIVAEANPNAYSQALGFFVRTGSRDESADLSGVSHFLEHMVFKGTPRRTAADVNRELDEIGSQSNAETSEEHTIYYAAVLPEYQQRAVDLLADIMRPSLRQDDFDTEKQVILEEIAKYEDQPPFGAFERSLAARFGAHPLGQPVLGTINSVQALTTEQMQGYFETHYSPGNLAVVASGQVDFDALVQQAEQACGHWTPAAINRDTRPPETFDQVACCQKDIAAQEYVLWLFRGPAADDESRYASRLLNVILGDDSGSRLFWQLVDTGRAEYAALFSHEYIGCGLTIGYLCCAPEDVEENLQEMWRTLNEAAATGFQSEELERAKSKACSSLVLGSERPRNRLFEVGARWLRSQPYRTVREEVDAYQGVTLEMLSQQLQQFPYIAGTLVGVGPLDQLQHPG